MGLGLGDVVLGDVGLGDKGLEDEGLADVGLGDVGLGDAGRGSRRFGDVGRGTWDVGRGTWDVGRGDAWDAGTRGRDKQTPEFVKYNFRSSGERCNMLESLSDDSISKAFVEGKSTR